MDVAIEPGIPRILKRNNLKQVNETSLVPISVWVPDVIAVVSVGGLQHDDVNILQSLAN
jgi:hypothetical protein